MLFHNGDFIVKQGFKCVLQASLPRRRHEGRLSKRAGRKHGLLQSQGASISRLEGQELWALGHYADACYHVS